MSKVNTFLKKLHKVVAKNNLRADAKAVTEAFDQIASSDVLTYAEKDQFFSKCNLNSLTTVQPDSQACLQLIAGRKAKGLRVFKGKLVREIGMDDQVDIRGGELPVLEEVVRQWNSLTDFTAVQRLYKVYTLWGFDVWKTETATADVPSWALIQVGALGYTEWKSPFSEYIR